MNILKAKGVFPSQQFEKKSKVKTCLTTQINLSMVLPIKLLFTIYFSCHNNHSITVYVKTWLEFFWSEIKNNIYLICLAFPFFMMIEGRHMYCI